MNEMLLEVCVDGVDFDSDTELDVIGRHFADWGWSAIDGQIVISVSGSFDPVAEALRIAAALQEVLPGARVVRWHEDFVGYSEIAQRAGVSREAVRLWAKSMRGPQDFPAARGYVGAGDRRSPLWTWAAVATWLGENDVFEDQYTYPSERQVAEINWALMRLRDREVVGV